MNEDGANNMRDGQFNCWPDLKFIYAYQLIHS